MFNYWVILLVKNVNKLRLVGGVDGGMNSPVYKICVQFFTFIDVKVRLIQQSIPSWYTVFSTYKNDFLHLLKVIYTHNPQHLLLRQLKKN